MKKAKLSTRITSILFSFLLISSSVAIPSFADGSEGAYSAALAVSNQYASLNAGEKAILESDLIDSPTVSYDIPANDDFHINVDFIAKTVRADTTVDGESVWTPVSARIAETGEDVDFKGVGTYSCDLDDFTVEVKYQAEVTVSGAVQKTLLNGPFYLIKGISNIETLVACRPKMQSLASKLGSLNELLAKAKSSSFSSLISADTLRAAEHLAGQITETGSLNIDDMLGAYSASDSKSGFLFESGQALLDKANETYGELSTIVNDSMVSIALATPPSTIKALLGITDQQLNDVIAAKAEAESLLAQMKPALDDDWSILQAENNIFRNDLNHEELSALDGFVAEGAGAQLHNDSLKTKLPGPSFFATKNVHVIEGHTEHSFEKSASVEPTCTADGHTVYHCTVCGYEYTEVSEALGHDFGEWTETAAATCTKKGSEQRKCSRCETTENRETAALGHDYTVTVIEPGCETTGITKHVCRRCNDTYSDSRVAALGHDFSKTTVAVKPSCTEPGLEKAVCSRCGEIETRAIAAYGHDFGRDGKAAKCTRCGLSNPNYKASVSFTDVPEGAYFVPSVSWAVENKITEGTGVGTFSPDKACTRGQVVTFLWRAKGSPEPESTANPFTDVRSSDYYYKAVLWAVEKGITLGTSKNTFSPNATCTRGQIVTFLWRANSSPAPSNKSNPFSDVTSSDYFYSAILWAVERGITVGTSPTAFSPNSDCTRAQIVTFIYRDMTK